MAQRQVLPAAAAFAADVACIVAFAAVGRRNHGEALSVAGVTQTAWPFVAGAAVGWLAARGWRRPTALVPTGLAVWVGAVTLGMALRHLTSQGTALSFVVVATLTTGALLLGWRAVRGWRRPAGRQRRRTGPADPPAAA